MVAPTPSSRRARRAPRLALATAAAVALTAAAGAGYLVGQDGSREHTDGAPTTDASPVGADLAPAEPCEQLLASYVRRARTSVTAWGWRLPVMEGDLAGASEAARDATALAATPQTVRATDNQAGTNVQEASVDEADTVKTDGELLVRIVDDTLETWDVTGDEPDRLSELHLDDVRHAELLLAGDRVVVVGRDADRRRTQRMLTLDLSDPSAPDVVAEHVWRGSLVAVRMHGSGADAVVRLVVTPTLPRLDFVRPTRGRSVRKALEVNRRVVARSTIADWLPTLDGRRLPCTDIAIPGDRTAPLGTVVVSAFSPARPDETVSTGLAAGAATAYVSADRLYLADAANPWGWGLPVSLGRVAATGRPIDDGIAQVHAFALAGLDTTYVASGEVEGSIADRWAMDSVDGVLRVAVGTSPRTGPANSVVTLREQDGELEEVGRLDGLGRGEEIKSVRWSDDLAIVVTFRQVDPLYAVDLSDPAAPELLGQLKVPGFSDYLHPLGSRRLIGIGHATGRWGMSTGAQAALFAVRDLTNPRRLDQITYPRGSQGGASTDPRQFTWLPEQRVALTTISRGWAGRRGWLSILRVGDGRLSEERLPLPTGEPVAQVRTVPLPNGAVVLVTGDAISFLDLGPDLGPEVG